MGTILSCGHREDNEENQYSITTKEWEIGTEGWGKALSYKTVCPSCHKECQKQGSICRTDKEAFQWLHSDTE
jgi:hypothetical protein